MELPEKIKTILTETFGAPRSSSYVISTPSGEEIVLRQGGNYRGVNLSGCNLSGLNLEGSNFTEAKMVNADLTGTNLSGAILSGADLTGAIVTNTHFEDSAKDGLILDDIRYTHPPSGL